MTDENEGGGCTSCGGSGSKFVQRGDDVLMEQCECSVKKTVDGVNYLGSHFKGLWLDASGTRILQEIDGVVTLRHLEAGQIKQACNGGPNRPMIWSVAIVLISELAKTQRELEATRGELVTTKERLVELQRKIEPLERAVEWVWRVRTAPQRIVKDKLRGLWNATVRVGTPHF